MTRTKEQEKAAIEQFRKSHDLLQLQYLLGHKRIRSTLNFALKRNLLQKED